MMAVPTVMTGRNTSWRKFDQYNIWVSYSGHRMGVRPNMKNA